MQNSKGGNKMAKSILTKLFGNKIVFVTAKSVHGNSVNIVYGSQGEINKDKVMVLKNLKLYDLQLVSLRVERSKKVELEAGFHRLLK